MAQYIYIVFSATPYKMGKFIRKITGQQYNHVSISLDEGLRVMYSFARHHQDIPLYGGFVEETSLRYQYKNVDSQVEVYAIPLSELQFQEIENYLCEVQENRHQYLYNTISAIGTLFRCRVHIDKSYTCTEFVVTVLSKADKEINEKRFYTIFELQNKLSTYLIYQGKLNHMEQIKIAESEFLKRHNAFLRSYHTCVFFGRLFCRGLLSVLKYMSILD